MHYNIFNLFFRMALFSKRYLGSYKRLLKRWLHLNLSTILARYQLKDIFHADEFDLFYHFQSKHLFYDFQDKRCSVGKHSKVRLTGMAASNAPGEKIPMFVIGKSTSSRCFKHVRNIPSRYRSQKKAWTDGTLFQEWLHELDRKFEMQGRMVVMIADNCPARLDSSWLKAINLQFLLPDNTSCTQPMNQRVIRYVCSIIFLFY